MADFQLPFAMTKEMWIGRSTVCQRRVCECYSQNVRTNRTAAYWPAQIHSVIHARVHINI